jgi:hypothetical protein
MPLSTAYQYTVIAMTTQEEEACLTGEAGNLSI